MDKDEDGGATNWVEGTQNPHGIRGAESEDVLAFANDHGRLKGEREREGELVHAREGGRERGTTSRKRRKNGNNTYH